MRNIYIKKKQTEENRTKKNVLHINVDLLYSSSFKSSVAVSFYANARNPSVATMKMTLHGNSPKAEKMRMIRWFEEEKKKKMDEGRDRNKNENEYTAHLDE